MSILTQIYNYFNKPAKKLVAQERERYINDAINPLLTHLDRTKAEIQLWRDALAQWEDAYNPQREKAIQLYNEISLDDNVQTCTTNIINKVLASEFEVGKEINGEFIPDPEKTTFFKSEFFEEVIRQIIDSKHFAYSLLELKKPTGLNNYNPEDLQLVPRHLVLPEKKEIMVMSGNPYNTISYAQKKYQKRLLEFGNAPDKGLFNNIAVLYIYKKNALAYWDMFISKFGVPPVIVKTNLSDRQNVNDLIAHLESMRSSSFGILGYSDDFQIASPSNTDSYQTFLELIKLCNEQITRVLQGETMTSISGSSQAQANVHENTSKVWEIANLRNCERLINKYLIPIIQQDFTGWENIKFRYKERKDIDLFLSRVEILKRAGYSVNLNSIIEFTGMEIEEVKEEIKQQKRNENK
jgi:hypothetical protein